MKAVLRIETYLSIVVEKMPDDLHSHLILLDSIVHDVVS